MNQPQGVGKFQPQAPAGHGFGARPVVPAATVSRPLPRQSRWSGLGDGSQRTPLLEPGYYRVRVGHSEIKVKPKGAPNAGRETFHTAVEVVLASEGSQSPVGMVANVLAMLSTDAGLNETFRFVSRAAGYEDEEAFHAAFPRGEVTEAFFDAVCGHTNEVSPIEGRLVDVQVARGKDDGNGGYYRDYIWAPVPEENQDQTKKPGT